MVEHLRGGTSNITHMSAANYSRLPKLVPNELSHSTLTKYSDIQI